MIVNKKIYLSYLLLFPLIFVIIACHAPPVMTQGRFEMIQIGSSIESVKDQFGDPYDVHRFGPDWQEYRYIERIGISERNSQQVEYILQVHNGIVVNKTTNVSNGQSGLNGNF
jgi:hypothetical protein